MTPAPVQFAGAVLCGGASRRMGRDKALLQLEGRPLARRVADALLTAGAATVVAVGGDAAALARWGLDPVPDDHPGEGPLGAVLTALRRTPDHDQVAVLACDLVEPDPATIAAVAAALADAPGADVAVPVAAGRRHFHHAVWHRRALAPIHDAFLAGERAPRRIARSLRVREVAVSRAEVLRDVDDPTAFRRAQRAFGPHHPTG